MKIGVCVKHVPDTAANIKVKSDGSGIEEQGVKFAISPYDEFAVEEALKTKENLGSGEVFAMTVGSKKSQEVLRSALAMGCDKATHIEAETVDPLMTAKLLAKKVQAEGLELVFTGRHATDQDNAQVSQMMAEILGWPHVTVVSSFELDGNKAKLTRDADGGTKEQWEVELPAVIAASKGLNEPRYASLKGIMQAKSKPLENLTPDALGLSGEDAEAKVEIKKYMAPPERKAGQMFKDDPEQAVKDVVRLLREEAKVI